MPPSSFVTTLTVTYLLLHYAVIFSRVDMYFCVHIEAGNFVISWQGIAELCVDTTVIA